MNPNLQGAERPRIAGFPVVPSFRDDSGRASFVPLRVDYDATTATGYAVLALGEHRALDEAAHKAATIWPDETFCVTVDERRYAYVDLERFDSIRSFIERSGVNIALNKFDILRVEAEDPVLSFGMAWELAGGTRVPPWEAFEDLRERIVTPAGDARIVHEATPPDEDGDEMDKVERSDERGLTF